MQTTGNSCVYSEGTTVLYPHEYSTTSSLPKKKICNRLPVIPDLFKVFQRLEKPVPRGIFPESLIKRRHFSNVHDGNDVIKDLNPFLSLSPLASNIVDTEREKKNIFRKLAEGNCTSTIICQKRK